MRPSVWKRKRLPNKKDFCPTVHWASRSSEYMRHVPLPAVCVSHLAALYGMIDRITWNTIWQPLGVAFNGGQEEIYSVFPLIPFLCSGSYILPVIHGKQIRDCKVWMVYYQTRRHSGRSRNGQFCRFLFPPTKRNNTARIIQRLHITGSIIFIFHLWTVNRPPSFCIWYICHQ